VTNDSSSPDEGDVGIDRATVIAQSLVVESDTKLIISAIDNGCFRLNNWGKIAQNL
jgi:hypothetical protein